MLPTTYMHTIECRSALNLVDNCDMWKLDIVRAHRKSLIRCSLAQLTQSNGQTFPRTEENDATATFTPFCGGLAVGYLIRIDSLKSIQCAYPFDSHTQGCRIMKKSSAPQSCHLSPWNASMQACKEHGDDFHGIRHATCSSRSMSLVWSANRMLASCKGKGRHPPQVHLDWSLANVQAIYFTNSNLSEFAHALRRSIVDMHKIWIPTTRLTLPMNEN
jgi:hypothetical protein